MAPGSLIVASGNHATVGLFDIGHEGDNTRTGYLYPAEHGLVVCLSSRGMLALVLTGSGALGWCEARLLCNAAAT